MNLKERFNNMKEQLTSDEAKQLMLTTAKAVVVGVAINVTVKLATDAVMGAIEDYRNPSEVDLDTEEA